MSSSSTPPTYQNQTSDPRSMTDAELLLAVSNRQPLALTEAYHRTVSAAHAVVRRLLNDSDKIEEVLTRVYSRLWTERPTDVPLEGWARAATWDIGTEVLRREHLAPISPSVGDQLPDLPTPDARFVDTAERTINELPNDERTALLQAHDQGIASVEQESSQTAKHLVSALVNLAGANADEQVDAELIRKYPGIADWAMGTASPTTVQVIENAIEEDQDLAELSRTLRRGRRRIEGLPATPDMGARILVSILAVTSDSEATLRPTSPVSGVDTSAEAPEEAFEAPVLHAVEDQPALVQDEPAVEAEPMPALTVVSDQPEPVFDDTAYDGLDEDLDTQMVESQDGFKAELLEPTGEEDSLEGGLLGDDPFGENPTQLAQDWVPQSTDTSEMRLRDVIEGAVDDDEDPFGDDDLSPYQDERMPRTAQSGRIADGPLPAGYDDTDVQGNPDVIGFDDPNAATTQFQAIGQGSEDTLYNDADTPYEESSNPVMRFLEPLLANQAIREWALPLLLGVIVGLILGKLFIG